MRGATIRFLFYGSIMLMLTFLVAPYAYTFEVANDLYEGL